MSEPPLVSKFLDSAHARAATPRTAFYSWARQINAPRKPTTYRTGITIEAYNKTTINLEALFDGRDPLGGLGKS